MGRGVGRERNGGFLDWEGWRKERQKREEEHEGKETEMSGIH